MNIIKNAKGLLIALTLVTGSAQADFLETDYVADNFSFGNMFDVNITNSQNDLMITGFDLNFGVNTQADSTDSDQSTATTTDDEIYTPGSGAGIEINRIKVYAKVGTWDINGDGSAGTTDITDPRHSSHWELIAVVRDTVSAGSGNATHIDITPFSMSYGINSFWITSTDGDEQLNYLGTGNTYSEVGSVISFDDNLEILSGAGLRYQVNNESLFTAREFTGAIYYDVPAPTTLAIFGLALLGLAGARRKA